MTYNDDNQIATLNGQTVTYDHDGNMTIGPLTNNTLVTYTYDARNRLWPLVDLQYGYDPAGNRTTVTNGGRRRALRHQPERSSAAGARPHQAGRQPDVLCLWAWAAVRGELRLRRH